MIALFSDLFRPKLDGVSVYLDTYTQELDRREYPYHLYAPRTPGNSPYVDNDHIFRFRSIPAFFYPGMRLSIPANARHLHRLYTYPYKVLHSHTLATPTAFLSMQVSKVRGIPHVHTFHGYMPDYAHYFLRGQVITPRMVERMCKWWGNNVDYIIVPTEKIYKWLNRIGISSDMRVIHVGVDLEKFKRETDDNYLVDRGFVNPDDIVLLFVGRLGREKSIDLLINHYASLPGQVRNRTKLVLVGDGPAHFALEQQAEEKGIKDRVVFTGFVDMVDIPKVYKSADVFTFLSTTETQGLVAVEALASGLPVLLAKDPAYDGMLKEGENGFFVESEKAFVEHVTTLVEDPDRRKRMASRSQSHSIKFDLVNSTDQILSYYDYANERHQKKHERNPFVRLGAMRAEVATRMRRLETELRTFIRNPN